MKIESNGQLKYRDTSDNFVMSTQTNFAPRTTKSGLGFVNILSSNNDPNSKPPSLNVPAGADSTQQTFHSARKVSPRQKGQHIINKIRNDIVMSELKLEKETNLDTKLSQNMDLYIDQLQNLNSQVMKIDLVQHITEKMKETEDDQIRITKKDKRFIESLKLDIKNQKKIIKNLEMQNLVLKQKEDTYNELILEAQKDELNF